MTATPAFDELCAYRRRIYRLEHLQALASWDRMTFMPPGGAQARAAAQGELAALLQDMAASPELTGLVARAQAEPLDPVGQAEVALARHELTRAAAVPEALARRRTELAGKAGEVWTIARAQNDWSLFARDLAPLLECVREIAERIGQALGCSPYDALLDGFDRGLTSSRVESLFAPLRDWLPPLIAQACAGQRGPLPMEGPFDPELQRGVCREAMQLFGFDFDRGRLDISAHPFSGGAPEDVRLTTQFREDQVLPALTAVIHETGHGRYQAGLPRERLGMAIGEACSAAMHEAQALCFERQTAPTRGFAARLSGLLEQAFGPQVGFAPDNLRATMTRVRPGPIRVEADELTYPAHVMLRVEIEQALFAGEIGVADIPAWWDERMLRLLGLDTRGDYSRGPLQDIHWSQGMFGYFPSYLLGAMIAAQLVQAFRRTRPGDQLQSEAGDLDGLPEWLAERVWRRGALLTTEALVIEATGAPLSDGALRRHLEWRYAA